MSARLVPIVMVANVWTSRDHLYVNVHKSSPEKPVKQVSIVVKQVCIIVKQVRIIVK